MDMKKTILLPFAALALIASSCSDDNPNDWDKQTINMQTSGIAVVIPSATDQDPVFVPDYQLRYSKSIADGKVSVKSMTPLRLPDGNLFSFESPATDVTGNQLTTIVEPLPFETPEGQTVRLRSRVTSQYYYYDRATGKTMLTGPQSISLTILNIGTGYTVKTIQPRSWFAGTTKTLVNGDNPYSNSEILYEVNLDVVNRKATVLMYNAKFAEAAPNIRVLRLRDLTLRTDRSSGYVIEGTGIVPEVEEGSQWVPNQRFTFDSFTLVPTSDNLSRASINYRVAGIFTGQCTASYIIQ